MTSTRTISGRVARVVLVLAALASLTSASVAQASVQRRGTSDFASSQWLKAPGLRWQAIASARARQAVPGYYGSRAPYAPTVAGTQPLPRYYGSTAPYALTATHEQPLPRYYGSTAPYALTATHEQPLPHYYGSTAPYTPTASVTASNGFNWGDAGIGVAVGIGAMLLAGAAAVTLLRQGRLATH
jgi:hypothetical protein